MPQDKKVICRVIGYDLRVWPNGAAEGNTPIRLTIDPTIWRSARDIQEELICEAYGVERATDVSNGLNLAISPPQRAAPEGFVWAAFDAPEEIVARISESFGMQHSWGTDCDTLSANRYVCLGYDVVDIWTQRTALYPSNLFQAVLDSGQMDLNKWGLLLTRDSAANACLIADTRNPDSSPFQPVGIWAKS